MKKSAILLLLVSSFSTAAETRLKPTRNFDLEATLKLLDVGDCVIRGTAFVEDGRRHYPRAGELVSLTPLTPYYEECLALAKAHPGKPIDADPQALSVACITKVIDDQGHFLFTGLKPGRYLISTKIQWVGRGAQTVQTGSTEYYNWYGVQIGSTPIYERQDYVYKDVRVLSQAAELSHTAQTLEFQLTE